MFYICPCKNTHVPLQRFEVAKWLVSLASNHRLSPLCGSSRTSGNAGNLSQYDPGC